MLSHQRQITCLINRVDAFSSRLLQSRSDNKQAANTLGQTGDETAIQPMTCFCIFNSPVLTENTCPRLDPKPNIVTS